MIEQRSARVAVTGSLTYKGQQILMTIVTDKEGRWALFFIGPEGIACFGGEGGGFSQIIPQPGDPA